MDRLQPILPIDILEKYEIYNYYHAAEILSTAYQEEFQELIYVLRNVNISIEDVLIGGGNESAIPPKFKNVLFPLIRKLRFLSNPKFSTTTSRVVVLLFF